MKNVLLTSVALIALTSCAPTKILKSPSAFNLVAQITYADNISSKVVFEGDRYKMLVFALKKDQILKPHAAPMDAPLYMLEGTAVTTIGTLTHTLVAGDMILLPKDILHDVTPLTDCKFSLIK